MCTPKGTQCTDTNREKSVSFYGEEKRRLFSKNKQIYMIRPFGGEMNYVHLGANRKRGRV